MLAEFSFPSLGAHNLQYSNLQVQTPKEALEITQVLFSVSKAIASLSNTSSSKTLGQSWPTVGKA